MAGRIRREKTLAIALLLLAFLLPVQTQAQDLEPRRWSH
jgi:hypothetical protein